MNSEPKIVFIGGTGRSGTNITKYLLALHPQVATLPFEYRFIIDPDGLIDFYTSYTASWSPYLADRRIKRLDSFLNKLSSEPTGHRFLGNFLRWINKDGKIFSPRQYHGWQLEANLPNFSQHTQQLLTQLIAFTFPGAWTGTESYTYRPYLVFAGPKSKHDLAPILGNYINNLVKDLLQYQQKQVYVEDNTWNILFAEELLELVPHAKLLHVYRDPRDVVASFIAQRWAPSDVKQAAIWYNSLMSHWFQVKANLPLNSFFEFSLESLIASPEKVIGEICNFIGLPFESKLISIDLGRSNSGRWHRDFSTEEKEILQSILGDTINRLGYY